MTGFSDDGFQGSPTNNDEGGYFLFSCRGRFDRHTVARDGSGKGAIDCASQKIKMMIIEY